MLYPLQGSQPTDYCALWEVFVVFNQFYAFISYVCRFTLKAVDKKQKS